MMPCLEIVEKIEQSSYCGEGTGGTGGNSNGNLQLNKMTIKDLKEGWPGRPEIHFKGYKFSAPPSNDWDCGEYMYASVNCYNYEGRRIARIKRKWKKVLEQVDDIRGFLLTTAIAENNDGDFFKTILDLTQ
ncbi:MAG: hypothetical protein ACON30_01920 [Flavobacteriaceae bacterium]